MAKHQPGVWGIDLGQCALKALRLQEVGGEVAATAFDYVEYPKVLSQPDADPDALIREALNTFLSRNNLRGDTVCISVPGQSGLARFVKLPPVEEKKIADIVKFEAKQQIPFNLDEVVWDYQKIGASNVVDGFALETEIGLFAMKRDTVNRYLQHFKEVGVEVHVIQMAPLALCNFLAFDLLGKGAPGAKGAPDENEGGKKGCVVALDIGADSSNLVITNGERIIWQRPIPLGGNHFTRALTKDLKLTFAKAEHLKRNATKSPDLKKILAALKPVLNDFVSEVQRSLAFFTNTHRDAPIEYMVGLGNAFRLPGLQRFLAEKLQLDVRKLTKMQRLEGEGVLNAVYTENILSFGVAYGLALQGLKNARLGTNLLPGEIRMERLVRAKKPWAVAAACLLLFGLAFGALGNDLSDRPYRSDAVKKAIDQANAQKKRAEEMEAAFQSARKKALAEEEAVKGIIAGQAERLNWVNLLQFVSECVPQPDAGDRNVRALGKKAFDDYRKFEKDEDKSSKEKEDYRRLWKDQVKDVPPPGGLPGKAWLTYWETTPDPEAHAPPLLSGKRAYKGYLESLKGRKDKGPKDKPDDQRKDDDKDADPLPPGADDLVLFYVEGIDSRFCDDLGAYWKKAFVDVKGSAEDVRPVEHAAAAPTGKGWVIEVQGYTYHHLSTKFVRETLMTNLALRGIRPTEKAKDKGKDKTREKAKGKGKDKGKAVPAPAGGPPKGPPGAPKPPTPKAKEQAPDEPVVNKISHVLLYMKAVRQGGATFEILGGSQIDRFRLLEGAAGGPPGASAPPGGSGGIKPPQVGAPGAPGVGAPPAPGSGTGAGPVTRPAWHSLAKGPTGAPPNSGPHTRTEFVILFVWHEPTPSDALRGMGEAPKAASRGPSGPGKPGMPGMPNMPGKPGMPSMPR